MRKIDVTYQLVTPESAEQGEASEHGYTSPGGYDHPMAPDLVGPDVSKWYDENVTPHWTEEKDHDPASDRTIAFEVAHWLRDNGYTEPSNSTYAPGTWYSWPDAEEDYSTGESRTESAHLKGFTPDEEREIGRLMWQHANKLVRGEDGFLYRRG